MATVTAPIAAVDGLPLSIIGYPTASYTTGGVDHHEIAWAALKEIRDQWASLEAGGGGGGGGGATTVVAAPTGNATTDTTNIQNALNAGGLVILFPGGGTYLVNPLDIVVDKTVFDLNGATLQGNGTGDHDATISIEGTGITTASNKRRITIKNGRIVVNVTPPAFSAGHQYQHGIVISGVSDVLCEYLEVVGPRGDGIYVGSGHTAAVERHNERVTIRKCFFDGVNKLNRNGVSVIDCSTFRMDDCYFTRFSHDTMPGPFDIEPNATYNIVRDIKVSNCTVDDCGGGVGMFAVALISNTQASMVVPITDIEFHNITVRNSEKTVFFAQQAGTPTSDTVPNDILVDGLFCDDVWKPFDMPGGIRGLTIKNLRVVNASGAAQIGYTNAMLDTTIEDFHMWKSGIGATYNIELFKSDRLTIRRGIIEGNGGGYVFRLGVGAGAVGSSNDLELSDITYRNVTGAAAAEFVNKHASHTITGTTRYFNIDQPDLPVAALSGVTDILRGRYVIRADVNRTLPNDTALNAIFNNPTNGRLTLKTGVYEFYGLFIVTAMSATSGNALINMLGAGTATVGSWMWRLSGLDGTTPATIADDDAAYFQTNASAASAVTAQTGTAMRLEVSGGFECTTGGTLIPSIDQVTAAAAVVQAGSFLVVERLGASGLVSIGPWD
jgi:hypothetical protein